MVTMISFFEGPAPPRSAMILGALVALGGGLYCSLYNLLQGTPESPVMGTVWAIANLVTWLAAFEISKRVNYEPGGTWVADWWRIGFILLATAFVSIFLAPIGRPLLAMGASEWAFELVRRLPSAGLVVILLLILPLLRRDGGRAGAAAEPEDAPSPDHLPLLPQQIDWIKAAGNYLEFRSGNGITLRRMTMAQAELLLGGEGFIRIHRSALVNREKVVRVARGKIADQIKLADGTWLKVGGAYRPFVAQLDLKNGY
jgi:hypothetical protein